MSLGVPERACPCGGVPEGAALSACCGPLIDGAEWPPTPERLMRSRYTAYALGETDHVFRTWHARTRPTDVSVDPAVRWTGLTVLATGGDDEEGTVEFAAHWVSGEGSAPQRGTLHERSRFVRRAGRWVYLDGTPAGPA